MAEYMVPGVPLIPQNKDMSCWYASAQMVIEWRRNKVQMCEADVLDPSESLPDVALYLANDGITDAEIVHFAKRLGLVAVPPMSPSEDALEQWLRHYGPLWVNGDTHIVVIVGIRPGEVFVHDPAPVNIGTREWRSLSNWYVDFRDENTTSGVFLHLPYMPDWTRRPVTPQPIPKNYTVVRGDSLSKIAQKFYGKAAEWPKIYDANRAVIGKNPNLIYPGQVFVIPPAA